MAAKFGPVDPFCWLLVVSMLPAVALMVIIGFLLGVLAIAFLAIAVLVFDSWANRARQGDPRRAPSRTPTGARRSRVP